MSSINAKRKDTDQRPPEPGARQWQTASAGRVVPLKKAEMDQVVRPELAGEAVAFPTSGRQQRPVDAAALGVAGLTQRYGSIAALTDVSFEVAAGEIIAVVGYSGSGKSTLLRLIAGLERPTTGTVTIGSRVVSGPSVFVPPEERGVGMMFQDYALFPHLSVLRNVTFGLRRRPAAEAKRIALRALERVGLGHRADAYPHALSGGEQQRVALARALVPEPAVLLMDEPFSNLDRRTREMVREETASVLRESGATSILVTHDHDDAMRLADRIILMQSGRIVQAGTAEDLYCRPVSLTVARFFAEFNEIAALVRDGAVATPIGTFPAPGLADGTRATVCIRLSDLSLAPAGEAGVEGRIVSQSFLGDEQLLHVAVPGLEQPLMIQTPVQALTGIGSAVVVRLAPDSAFVFAAER